MTNDIKIKRQPYNILFNITILYVIILLVYDSVNSGGNVFQSIYNISVFSITFIFGYLISKKNKTLLD